MREQANIAINIADVILFITDLKQGVIPADEEIAMMLRKSKKPVVLVCNKADHIGKTSDDIYEFYNLGLGAPFPVSSTNALGIGDVLDAICEKLPPKKQNEEEDNIVKVAVIRETKCGKIIIS